MMYYKPTPCSVLMYGMAHGLIIRRYATCHHDLPVWQPSAEIHLCIKLYSYDESRMLLKI